MSNPNRLCRIALAVLALGAFSAVPSSATSDAGYWLAGADGGVFAFGRAQFYGGMADRRLNAPIVGIAPTKSGQGYWMAAADGGVFSFGDARFYGSLGGTPLAAPIVALERSPSGEGYWLLGRDGGVFAFGDAGYFGAPSAGGQPTGGANDTWDAMAATASGKGYWLLRNGSRVPTVVAFGDAKFAEGGFPLDRRAVDLVQAYTGNDWTALFDDGSLSSSAGAHFSSGTRAPTRIRLTAIDRTRDASGYWVVAEDGGVFCYGDVPFLGSLGGRALNAVIVDIASLR